MSHVKVQFSSGSRLVFKKIQFLKNSEDDSLCTLLTQLNLLTPVTSLALSTDEVLCTSKIKNECFFYLKKKF